MIKNTFQTLKNHPELILGMLAIVLVMVLVYIPIISGMDDLIMNFQRLENGQTEAAHDVVSYYATVTLLSIFAGIFSGFFALPVLMNRAYEACAGVAEPGWIARGMKKCWWKPFVMGLIIGAGAMVVLLFSMFLAIIPVLGPLIIIAVMIAIGVFAIIAYTAVIAEPDFGAGLGGTFKTGSKYFFKLLGVMALFIVLPMFLLSTVSGIAMSKSMMDLYSSSAAQNPNEIISYMSSIITPMLIMSGIMSVYFIFAYPFIYTYSMHQYLSVKGVSAIYTEPVSDYVIQSRDMTL